MSTEEIYAAALDSVFRSGKASPSAIQRAHGLRWNDACEIVERMEREGHVSPVGLGGRRIVIDREPARSIFLAAEDERIKALLVKNSDTEE